MLSNEVKVMHYNTLVHFSVLSRVLSTKYSLFTCNWLDIFVE